MAKAQKAARREEERVRALPPPVPARTRLVLDWEEWKQPRLLEWYDAYARQRRLRRRRAKSRAALAGVRKMEKMEDKLAGERLRDWLSCGQGGDNATRSVSRACGGARRAYGTRAGGGSQLKLQTWLTVGSAGSGVGGVGGRGQEVARAVGQDGRTASRKTRQSRWAGR